MRRSEAVLGIFIFCRLWALTYVLFDADGIVMEDRRQGLGCNLEMGCSSD